ncbi:hypothetical protein EON63_04960 [archaeon]|nr:MAG: hypothetical protein EON63_04960 [archaeon]
MYTYTYTRLFRPCCVWIAYMHRYSFLTPYILCTLFFRKHILRHTPYTERINKLHTHPHTPYNDTIYIHTHPYAYKHIHTNTIIHTHAHKYIHIHTCTYMHQMSFVETCRRSPIPIHIHISVS